MMEMASSWFCCSSCFKSSFSSSWAFLRSSACFLASVAAFLALEAFFFAFASASSFSRRFCLASSSALVCLVLAALV
ncbi:Uncharacterised protein [Segatella copri]|nr:Uncharacterised protein [Segatella copri]